jgi:hypothetical protein
MSVVQSLNYIAEQLDYLEFLLATQFDDALCDIKLRSMSPRIRASYSEDRDRSISEFRTKQASLFHLECLRDYPYEALGAARPEYSDTLAGDEAWFVCCDGLSSLVEGLLATPLAEAQHDGYWLLRFLSSYSLGMYDAWDKADLLNALVTAQLLAGDNYEDIAAAAVSALRATGVESVLPLLMHDFQGGARSAMKRPDSSCAAPSYHLSHFSKVNFQIQVDHELSLMDWLEDIQELMRRWQQCGSLCGLAYRTVAFEAPEPQQADQEESTAPRVVVGSAGAFRGFYEWNIRRFIREIDDDLFEALVDQRMASNDLGARAKSSVVTNADAPAASPTSSLVVLLSFEFHTAAESSWIASDAAALQVNVEIRLTESTWGLHSIESRLLRSAASVTPTDELVPLVTKALGQLLDGDLIADQLLRTAFCTCVGDPAEVPLLHVSRPSLKETPPPEGASIDTSKVSTASKWRRVSAGGFAVHLPLAAKEVHLRLGDTQESIRAEFAFGGEILYAGPTAMMAAFPDSDDDRPADRSDCEKEQVDLSGLIAVGYRGDPDAPDYLTVSEMATQAASAGAIGLIVVNKRSRWMLRASGVASGERPIPVVAVEHESGALILAAGVIQLECVSVLPSLLLPEGGVVSKRDEDAGLVARILEQLGQSEIASEVRAQHGIPSVEVLINEQQVSDIAAAFAFGPSLESWTGSNWEAAPCMCAGPVVPVSEEMTPSGKDATSLAGAIALVTLPPVTSWAETCDVTWRWFRDMAQRVELLGAVALLVATDSDELFLPEGAHSARGTIPVVSICASGAARLLDMVHVEPRLVIRLTPNATSTAHRTSS